MNSGLISVIIPCRNEEEFIANTLDSILESNYDINSMEILVVDGMSDDRTREIVSEYAQKNPMIRLIDNPQRTVPYAMNYGIEQSHGDVIVRLDAHSVYPSNYISELVHWLKELNVENVGGVWDATPTNDSLEARAVAYATAHPFGIGNAQYRISEKTEPYEVDTVPFGCYRRDVFDKIGLFDTDLTRNQDDELNARLIQDGGKIYLIPTLKIKYFARENFSKLVKMFFQYGYFKPLVNLKLKQPATLRQFVPPLFVLFLFFVVLSFFIMPALSPLFVAVLTLYATIDLYVSYNLSKKYHDMQLLPYLASSFVLIHLSYGYGYLKGIVDFVILKKHRKKDLSQVNISR